MTNTHVLTKVHIVPVNPKYTPTRQHPDDAGFDLYARVDSISGVQFLAPGSTIVVPVGFSMALPRGFEAQIRSRSGLAAKSGIFVLNSPGTVDSGYRGEVGVILHNTSSQEFLIKEGDRIAQMVIQSLPDVALLTVTALGTTGRGSGGFGSTGA